MPDRRPAFIKAHGILIVNALFVIPLVVVGVLVFGFHVGALRQVAGWVFLGVFAFGGGLWLAASWEPPASNRGKVWGELGRSLLVAGLMAFAVWAVAELRRPIEAHHSLQLTLGSQQAMPGIDLHGEDLSDFDLSDKDLSGSDLAGSNLSGAALIGTDLSGANLSKADLSGAELKHADLSGARLDEAELNNANAELADLRQARLPEADLSGARLGGALMQGACLSGASLANAYLPDTHLKGADLYHVDLENTHFWYDLRGAYMASIGLRGARHAGSAHWPPRVRDEFSSLVHPSEEGPPHTVPSRTRRGATVRYVADGDTVALNVEKPHGVRMMKVRLIGIDSPDLGEGGSKAAQELLRQLLPVGTRVTYEYDATARDGVRRALLYVFAPDGSLVNQDMLEQGRATTRIDTDVEHPNVRYARQLHEGEAWAREHALGMWRTCPP